MDDVRIGGGLKKIFTTGKHVPFIDICIASQASSADKRRHHHPPRLILGNQSIQCFSYYIFGTLLYHLFIDSAVRNDPSVL